MAAISRPRPPIDWEKIEAEYRAGIVSIVELAATHGISRMAIQKRAKASAWARNLTDRIRRAAIAKAVAGEFTEDDEAATVEIKAEAGAKILRGQQKRAERLQGSIDRIEALLEGAEGLPVTLLAQAVNNLANARKTAFALERQAHGLDDGPSNEPIFSTFERVEIVAVRAIRSQN